MLKKLEAEYKAALAAINEKVKLFDYDISQLDAALQTPGLDEKAVARLESMKRSRVYQKQYQEALKGQIGGIVDRLHGDTYSTISEYLNGCYTDGFLGTMYSLYQQGIPLIMPIDQAAVLKAVQLDSKISKGLYTRLGVDSAQLKKVITSEITRGVASSMAYADIARNIRNASSAPLSNCYRIARTEGHRIQQASAADARNAAKKKGADVLKQWDATLDGRTRDTHRLLDGQIRETDEPFEANGKKAMEPGSFGDPAEDCNCRCVALTRARWALDEDELKTLKERAEYFGLDKTENFKEFQEKYLNVAENAAKMESQKFVPAKSIKEAEAFAQNTLGLNCSYKGVDLKCANDMNAAFQRGLDYCPAIKDRLNFVGSGQERNKQFKKEITDYYLNYLRERYPNQTDEWYNKYATSFARKAVGRIEGGTYAFASRAGANSPDVVNRFTGIVVNGKWGKSAETFINALKSDVKSGYHPTGCDTIASVFDHEIAHQIDYATGLRNSQAMKEFWSSLTKEDIEKGLSRYGASNIAEFIAEGYAEYCNNENPREIASKIGKIIEKAVGKA